MIKLSFTGDLMSKLPQNIVSKTETGYNYDRVFNKVSNVLKKSDYVVGNLETPIAGEECTYTCDQSVFNTPVEFVVAAMNAGFDCFTLANNHCLDRGLEGLFKTINNLESVGAIYTGIYDNQESAEKPLIIEVGGVRFAILSYTYGTNSKKNGHILEEGNRFCVDLFRKQDKYLGDSEPRWKTIAKRIVYGRVLPQFVREKIKPITVLDSVKNSSILAEDKWYDDRMKTKIQKAKEFSDVVIMCMHSGGQYNSTIGDYTRELAHRIIDYGCDIIIGNHPHCVLEAELYKNKLITYSLGNFCFTPNWGYYYKGVYADYSLILNLYFSNDGLFNSASVNILKVVTEQDGNSVVYPLADLIEKATLKEKRKLQNDTQAVLKRFFGDSFITDYNPEEELVFLTDSCFKF